MSHVSDEIAYRFGNAIRKVKDRIALIECQFPHDGCFRQTGVGHGAGQHFVHHESQAIEIATDIEQLSLCVFRKQIW